MRLTNYITGLFKGNKTPEPLYQLAKTDKQNRLSYQLKRTSTPMAKAEMSQWKRAVASATDPDRPDRNRNVLGREAGQRRASDADGARQGLVRAADERPGQFDAVQCGWGGYVWPDDHGQPDPGYRHRQSWTDQGGAL